MSRPDGNVSVKRRPRWRRWLLAVGLVLLAVVACWVAGHLLARQAAAREVAEAAAELDRTDPGWRLEDIEAARAVYPDEENGARYVEAASRQLPKDWPGKRKDGSMALSLETDEGPLGLQQALTPPQLPD